MSHGLGDAVGDHRVRVRILFCRIVSSSASASPLWHTTLIGSAPASLHNCRVHRIRLHSSSGPAFSAHKYSNQFYTTTALLTWCLDQVQIDFPIRLGSDYANETWKVLGNNFLFECPEFWVIHPSISPFIPPPPPLGVKALNQHSQIWYLPLKP